MRYILAFLLIALPCAAQWRTPDNPNYVLDAGSLKEFYKHFEKKTVQGEVIVSNRKKAVVTLSAKFILAPRCELWEHEEGREIGARIDKWGPVTTDSMTFYAKPGMKVWWSCEGWVPKQ